MLYIVSTPIGNLQDITLRALEVLRSSDAILCEDTRKSSILLKHYDIQKPLISYHAFNEKKRLKELLELLKEGKTLSLISDAGTPLISDPGLILLQECQKEKIPYSAIPGPCSLINALVLSGFPPIPFQFLGFLDKKPKKEIQIMLDFKGTSLAFESPYRIIKTLKIFQEFSPERTLCLVKEMTKKFELCTRGSPQDLLTFFETHSLKGEMVILSSPKEL